MRRVRAFILIGIMSLGLCRMAMAQEVIDAWTIAFEDSDIDKYVPVVSTDLDNPGFFGIRNGRFEINDMEGPDCGSSNTGNNGNRGILFSGITTSAYCDVSITFETSISDAIFEQCLTPGVVSPLGCTDFFGLTPGGDGLSFEVIYNGSRVMLGGYCGSAKEGRFTVSGLDIDIGDIYTVFLVGGTQSPDEAYYIERIEARGFAKSILSPEIVANQDSYCDAEGALFLNEISGGDNYVWTKDGIILNNNSDTYVKAPVRLADAGFYEVTFSDANGCSYYAATSVIVQDCQESAPVFSLDTIFCQGDVLVLPTTSDNGISGTWSTNSNEIVLNDVGYGTYRFTTNGNDRTYNYSFNVFPVYRDTMEVPLCPDAEYNADGNFLSIAGTTRTVLTYASQSGCDSNVYIKVVPLSTSRFYLRDTLCESEVYPLADMVLDKDNSFYHDTLINQFGCDSIIDVELTFMASQQTFFNPLICRAGAIEINGTTYDRTNPSGLDTLSSVLGCDSIITVQLDFIITDSITIDVALCPGEVKTIMGIEVDTSITLGSFYSIGENGCDTIINFKVEELRSTGSVIDSTLCIDDFIIANNNRYDSSNPMGTEVAIGSNGCDSIIDIRLQFYTPDTTNIIEDRCEGDGFEIVIDNQIFNESNREGQACLMNSKGCDSIVIIRLNYLSQLRGEELYNGCRDDGYQVMVNGVLYDQDNPTGTELISSSSGCDSLVTIRLSYRIISSGLISYQGCEGDGFIIEVNGQLYNEDNPVGVEIEESAEACDSLIEISLAFLPTIYEDINYQGCSGDSYTVEVNGTLYNEANPMGTETVAASTGCDSTIMIDLFYQLPDTTIISQEECRDSGFNITVNGTLYNQDNTEGAERLMNSVGCDSLVVVDLQFTDEVTHIIAERICSNATITVEGTTYDMNNPSGSARIMTNNGCDSIVEIDLSFYEDPNLEIVIDTIDSFGLYQLEVTGAIDTTTISWMSNPALSCLGCPNPTATITNSVIVEVTAEDVFGCIHSESVRFDQDNTIPSFYLPNIININSTIGNNMIRPVVPQGIEAIYDLTIYDRWGGVVYQVERVSTIHNNLGWRGMVDGQRAMIGTYIYLAKVYFNGSKEPIVKTGAVTVY